jgi:segregation and condensation protein B
MSLKAKLEAVIYAAEEPVTLAQLALLFTADALEWKAEQEAAAAAPAPETAEASLAAGESQLAANEEFDYDGLSESTLGAEPEAGADAESLPELTTGEVGQDEAVEPAAATGEGEDSASDSNPDSTIGEVSTIGEMEGETAETAPDAETVPVDEASVEASLKREARQRDREVRGILRRLLDELIAQYASDDRGVEIREIAGGYRMATKPEYHDGVRAFIKSLKPALKLSLPALETLAVIAYKQPVTAPEVNEIRGVDSSGVFGSLLARKLIATAGRKPVIGRPILYKTTKEFLLRFGLKDVTELPSMEEFEKMAAIELEEPEMEGPGESAQEIRSDLNEELSLETDGSEAEESLAEASIGAEGEASAEETESTSAAPPSTE